MTVNMTGFVKPDIEFSELPQERQIELLQERIRIQVNNLYDTVSMLADLSPKEFEAFAKAPLNRGMDRIKSVAVTIGRAKKDE